MVSFPILAFLEYWKLETQTTCNHLSSWGDNDEGYVWIMSTTTLQECQSFGVGINQKYLATVCEANNKCSIGSQKVGNKL
jgi:hypothetical protein